uniref:Ribosome-binding factor A n=1 Tax=Magnetococcus massalia (strain MO-1) TaxID=451514 RepID=A0A1S7LMU7_MAGMO|nr:Ribosome-binding factor A [Candidatus Magnetococcus massalia]
MTIRTERISGQIQQELARMLIRGEIKDPRLGSFINLTEVAVTSDLQSCKIYYTLYGVEEAPVAEALKAASGFIRSQLAKRLKLRHTPQLRFYLDQSLERGLRIEKMINELEIPPAEDDTSEDGENR